MMKPAGTTSPRKPGGTRRRVALTLAVAAGLLAAHGAMPGPAARKPTDAQAGAPRVEIDTTEIDLGELFVGEEADARFTLRNGGTGPLRILRADPG